MKSLSEEKEDALNITTGRKIKIQVKENNNLFNHIDKLAVDHDVIVSNTMIKVTYKKTSKDQSMVGSDSDITNINNKKIEPATVCSNDISVMMKTPIVCIERNSDILHSTPKVASQIEKKKKYLNGLNLSPKSTNSGEKSHVVAKVQKKPLPQKESASRFKKLEMISNKQIYKSALEKRFLKSNGPEKQKDSIFKGNKADKKKIKLSNNGGKKIKKLENGVKKEKAIDKKYKKIEELKRKSSNAGLDVVANKKVKLTKSDLKISGCTGRSEENLKSGNIKKPIMLVDPDLPVGWTRFIRTKNKGSANEQYVVYIVNPQGKKFRFKWKLRKYLQRTNSSLDADQFFFGLYQRPKTNAAGVWKGEVPAHNETPKKSPELSRGSESELSAESYNQMEENEEETNNESSNDQNRGLKEKELLLFDPDLPFGWKRTIHSDAATGRKQVHIISPDGKIFRRRYRLNEYLLKHQYNHNLDRFYFGLYPKKEGNDKDAEKRISTSVKMCKPGDSLDHQKNSKMFTNKPDMMSDNDNKDFKDSKIEVPSSPLYVDPNLPKGWKRVIKIRSWGESAGRMEVVIVSPDGRKHRTRKHLEHYLRQKKLNYKAEDFDFTVCGRANQKKRLACSSVAEQESEPEAEPANDLTFLSMKKKFTDKPVPELDIDSLKDIVITPEGHMINTVNGLMMCSGLTSVRNERRQRLPRKEHEKQLKVYTSLEGDVTFDSCEIPVHWIQKLVKCRGDFRILEPDAATTVAEATKEFIKKLSNQALVSSKQSESGLRYEDLADFIDRTESLSFLKILIPKKITFKEYIKLNRPKQFLSFT